MTQELLRQSFDFRRRIDGLTYHFHSCGPQNGKPAWKRVDYAVWLIWLDEIGWCSVDAERQINGVPWGIPASQQGDVPPSGEWVSKKGDKSYVYDLVFTEQSS